MKFKSWRIFSTCLLMSVGPAHAISNGRAVADDDPIRALTVSVYSADEDCTGVKIAPNLILTAKHCELDKSTKVIFSDGSSYKTVRYFIPDIQGANSGEDYDLAIIEIDGNVPGSVAQIASDLITPETGSTAWIAGYGGETVTEKSNPLRKIEVEIEYWDYSPAVALVHARNGGAVCDGDSGGPGYTQVHGQIVVWGIDSASLHEDPTCASHELYTKVAAKRDWIRKAISGARKRPISGSSIHDTESVDPVANE